MENKKENKNNERLNLRLSVETKNRLETLKAGCELKTYEELMVFLLDTGGANTEVKTIEIDTDGHCLKTINFLTRFSTNINQIAKVANSQQKLTDKELDQFRAAHSKLITARKYLVKNVKFLNGRI